MKPIALPAELFRGNRERLASFLAPNSIAVLNANDVLPTNADGTMPHHQNADLFYLTGVRQEETILLLAPDAPDPAHREVLFLRQPNDHLKIWEGHKLTKAEATAISGIANVRWLSEFPGLFRSLVCEANHLYFNTNEHARADVAVQSRDARFIEQCRQQFPLHEYRRLAPLVSALRAVKSAPEIAAIRAACDLTGRGFLRVCKFVRPGVNEAEVEAEFAHEFIRARAQFAYPPIIAGGANNNILHYTQNDQPLLDGQLLLLDVAACRANYMSDLTRTIPVNGRFTRRQRAVYEAVLRVFRQQLALLAPGKTTKDLRLECEEALTKECVDLGLLKLREVRQQDPANPAVRRYFMHGVSHPIGLDVHDVPSPHAPLAPGWVVTVEPGLYLKDEGFGIRLENTVLLTEDGPVDLMAHVPIEADEIEALMRKRNR